MTKQQKVDMFYVLQNVKHVTSVDDKSGCKNRSGYAERKKGALKTFTRRPAEYWLT